MSTQMPHKKAGKVGRPPKFGEPRRAITLTLPERTLKQLEGIDADRARAIVKSAEAVVAGKHSTVELVKMTAQHALIVTGPCQALKQIPWLAMVEIAPLRFLLAIPPDTAIETLELALLDLLDRSDIKANAFERATLEALRTCIGQNRREKHVTKHELLLVSM